MKRYPGIRPFRTDEKGLFFGRDADIERLYRLIDLEQLVILYGKSGYGKSSLLSAGIFPRLQTEARRRFWEIRLGPFKPGESLAPADAMRQIVLRQTRATQTLPGEPSLWQFLKTHQTPAERRFLLVFDQFEELFSYPPAQILEFKKQLAEALYSKVPKRYETTLAGAGLSPEQEDVVFAPFDLKVVFSIRSDRMSMLNNLKDYLPNLLQHGYELDALDESAATKAVTRPAGLREAESGVQGTGSESENNPHFAFDTPPFTYATDTLVAIFAALRNETSRIETSTLQIVCRYVEDNIAGTPNQTIRPGDLGDIKGIFRVFYERTLVNLPEAQQKTARRLIEDLLIKDGIRIPYAAQALLAVPYVTQDMLDRLTSSSLLRVERDERGRMIYEVGHDTLVAPIAEATQARRVEEENIRLREEADEQRREKEKAVAARRKAGMIASGAIVLAVVAVLASFIALRQTRLADEKAALAEIEKKNAEKSSFEAQLQKDTAMLKGMQADLNARLAREESDKAKLAEKRAKDALQLANGNAEVAVRVLLRIATDEVYHLNYQESLISFNAAAKLGQRKLEVANGLLDIAFFYTESGQYLQAKNAAGTAASLLGKSINLPDVESPWIQDALRQVLQKLDAGYYEFLRHRYYPVMVSIPGGEFIFGCIKPDDCAGDTTRYRVRLSTFQLAQTETTFWQWGLYCASNGLKIRDFAPNWGIDGDNPAVNVDWFHAAEYANWLSMCFGKDPIYHIDSVGKEKRNKWVVTLIPAAAEKGGFRLPTEAEWEYAARGGPKLYYYEYAGSSDLSEVGWFFEKLDTTGIQRTRPVAKLKPVEISEKSWLYDMSGNVWEWCWDWWFKEPHPDTFPPTHRGSETSLYKVSRGGSQRTPKKDAQVTSRLQFYPYDEYHSLGFRLAKQ